MVVIRISEYQVRDLFDCYFLISWYPDVPGLFVSRASHRQGFRYSNNELVTSGGGGLLFLFVQEMDIFLNHFMGIQAKGLGITL